MALQIGPGSARGQKASHRTTSSEGDGGHTLAGQRVAKGERLAKRGDRKSSAEMGVGTALAGTGLIAGGIPGAREPNTLNIWNVRGKVRNAVPQGQPPQRSRYGSSNGLHNAKIVVPQSRAGIFGFRANMHDAYIAENKSKTHGDAYVHGMRSGKLDAEAKIVRGMRVGRRASYGLTAGGAALALAGRRRAQGNTQVEKRDSRSENASAAALGAGGVVAGVGHFVPKGLGRYERHYADSAKGHVLAARKLAPHYGGLKTTPAKIDPDFGTIRRPAKTTMYPYKTDAQLKSSGASARIKGGDKVAAEVGRHRGIASQERHFAEAFGGTSRAIRRVRGPGLAVAGAGAAGLLAARDAKQPMSKSDRRYGYAESRTSPARAGELLAGLGVGAWGVSRSKSLGSLASFGVRLAEANGGGKLAARAMSLAHELGQQTRTVTGAGAAQARKLRVLSDAIDRVPAALRPAVATTAGIVLTSHARPVQRDRFVTTGRGF